MHYYHVKDAERYFSVMQKFQPVKPAAVAFAKQICNQTRLGESTKFRSLATVCKATYNCYHYHKLDIFMLNIVIITTFQATFLIIRFFILLEVFSGRMKIILSNAASS